MNYNDLKPKQQNFIHLLDAAYEGDATADTTFKRGFLKKIANDNGIAWAPAWIVKDTSRVRGRGEYLVPELAQYRGQVDEQIDAEIAEVDAMMDEQIEAVIEEAAAPKCDECPTADCVDCPVRPEHISEGAWGLLTEEEQMAAVA